MIHYCFFFYLIIIALNSFVIGNVRIILCIGIYISNIYFVEKGATVLLAYILNLIRLAYKISEGGIISQDVFENFQK